MATGLHSVGLSGKIGGVAKPKGNEDRAPTGMTKKWQQHYPHGKWVQFGKFSCQVCALHRTHATPRGWARTVWGVVQ